MEATESDRLLEKDCRSLEKLAALNGVVPMYQAAIPAARASRPRKAFAQRSTMPNTIAYGKYAEKMPSFSANFC